MRRLVALLGTIVLTSCSTSPAIDEPSGGESSTPAASTTWAYALGSELTPGTYTSQNFATPVTFTVPAGWKVFEDGPGELGLARIANDGPPLLVLRDIDAAATDCAEEAEPGVGRDPADIVDWLVNHDGLQTSDPVAVSIDRLDGYEIDLSIDPSWSGTCPFSAIPIVMTLVGSELSAGVHWNVDANESNRVWVLDLPEVEGGNIVLVGSVCCGVNSDEQLAAEQEVVDSLSFAPSDA
ncbi:hypothetical protein [Demequina salsinemoris]|uniref:hypothetical protein n=1 Tax=Demequina salsinemoris TaxID=577470 RepID=UPI000785669C|nr:hypothetical protein [Demequina salsinemoris]